MTNPTSNQCLYCGRENGEHNEVCVYTDNVRVRAERDDALEILAMALPGPRPWPTESIPSKLRIYREMALDKRRSSAVETTTDSAEALSHDLHKTQVELVVCKPPEPVRITETK